MAYGAGFFLTLEHAYNKIQNIVMKKVLFLLSLAAALSVSAKNEVTVTVHADKPGATINKNIYGQFSEHLGTCIYGGLCNS